jgi:hypothetical protein
MKQLAARKAVAAGGTAARNGAPAAGVNAPCYSSRDPVAPEEEIDAVV